MKNFWLGAGAGIVAGYVSNTGALVGSWYNLVFWAIVGLAIGLVSKTSLDARRMGATYGIFLSLSFLILAFGGTPDKILAYSILVLGLTLVGALGGLVSAYVGFKVRGIFKGTGPGNLS